MQGPIIQEANIEGVLVEEMAGDGTEVIIGSIEDPQFGPLSCLALGAF